MWSGSRDQNLILHRLIISAAPEDRAFKFLQRASDGGAQQNVYTEWSQSGRDQGYITTFVILYPLTYFWNR